MSAVGVREITHGLASTYRGRHACRCDDCRKANTELCKKERKARDARWVPRADESVPCDNPSRYQYQRGCRCPECRLAAAAYKRERAESKAVAEGRVYGHKPCGDCGTPISLLDGSSRKEFCGDCGALRVKEQRAKDRANRRESMRLYLRRYYRENYNELRLKHREYYLAHRDQVAAYDREIRAVRRRRDRESAWRNAALRDHLLKRAREEATGELADLIAEQEKEIRRSGSVPSWLISLDAPFKGQQEDQYEIRLSGVPRHLIEWHDPTFDAAVAMIAQAS